MTETLIGHRSWVREPQAPPFWLRPEIGLAFLPSLAPSSHRCSAPSGGCRRGRRFPTRTLGEPLGLTPGPRDLLHIKDRGFWPGSGLETPLGDARGQGDGPSRFSLDERGVHQAPVDLTGLPPENLLPGSLPAGDPPGCAPGSVPARTPPGRRRCFAACSWGWWSPVGLGGQTGQGLCQLTCVGVFAAGRDAERERGCRGPTSLARCRRLARRSGPGESRLRGDHLP